MSRYKAYPEYKDSGVEWLGKIPKNWSISKIKYIAPFQVGWTPSTKNDVNFEGENLWANISDLREKVIHDTAKKISDDAAKTASMNITPNGSLLYSFKLSVGTVSFAGKDMYTNEAIASFLDSAALPLSYLYYLLPKFVIENASTNIYGARILNQELINSAMVLDPSFQEAEKISNFLDHETAKIDTLIDKQQQLIKLLKEKRQAVISHAVTKGLNPNIPMRDSGVEWIGKIPSYWDMWKIAHACPYVASGTTPKSDGDLYYDGKYLWVTTGELRENIIFDTQKKVTDKALIDMPTLRLHPKGSVSIAMYGATIGRLAIFGKDATTNQACCVMPPSKVLHNKYLFYWLYATRQEIINLSSGGGQPNVNQEKIASLKVSSPDFGLQSQIANFLDHKTAKIDTLIEKQQQQIQLMQERRTTLISAAVTGKIDVRNWQPPKSFSSKKEINKENV
jgi:type I restriction enzyme S subunit